jgi:hypothetical protein
VLPVVLGGQLVLADQPGQLGDAARGQRLLGGGVEPQHVTRGAADLLDRGARGVVNAAAHPAPPVAARCPLHDRRDVVVVERAAGRGFVEEREVPLQIAGVQ